MYKKMNFNQRADRIQNVFTEQDHAAFAQLCVDVIKNKVVDYSTAEANLVISNKMKEIAGLSDNPTVKEVRSAMRKTAVREAIFEVISETVEDTLVSGWAGSPFFMNYVETRNGNLGDRNSFYVPDNTEIVISEVAGSNHDIIRQRLGAGREFSVTTKYYGAKVYMEAERYLMGVEDWSALIGKISSAYTRMINTLLHDAVMGAGSTLPSPEQWNVTAELVAENRDTFIKLISDVSTATGAPAVIMGTKVGLSNLTAMGNVDYISNEAKSDIYNTGRLAMFEGTQMIEIPQAFAMNDTSKYLVDDTKLLIMPGNIDRFVKLFYEGDTYIKEVSDRDTNTDHTFDYEMMMKLGVAVVTNTRFGTWTNAKAPVTTG